MIFDTTLCCHLNVCPVLLNTNGIFNALSYRMLLHCCSITLFTTCPYFHLNIAQTHTAQHATVVDGARLPLCTLHTQENFPALAQPMLYWAIFLALYCLNSCAHHITCHRHWPLLHLPPVQSSFIKITHTFLTTLSNWIYLLSQIHE
jgi:hypothetical protein